MLNEIGIVDQLASNRAQRLLAPELNLPQFVVLNHFYRLGGERSLVRLAASMQVTKGAMTNTVGRLARKGWLLVRPDPADKRGKLVSLSAAGAAARARALKRLGPDIERIAAALPQGQIEPALATLRLLRVWLDENR